MPCTVHTSLPFSEIIYPPEAQNYTKSALKSGPWCHPEKAKNHATRYLNSLPAYRAYTRSIDACTKLCSFLYTVRLRLAKL